MRDARNDVDVASLHGWPLRRFGERRNLKALAFDVAPFERRSMRVARVASERTTIEAWVFRAIGFRRSGVERAGHLRLQCGSPKGIS